ncbi:helix-turn-helix domain-containing protein [Seohaeicola saemankumensis]|uniref:Helix-turn-helix domain-containing protein n=1 Tax=Seohaeicola saemankumensis TaxID=481181 RepID=A0ABW3T9A0_9RHOB
MIGRRFTRKVEDKVVEPKGFDDYDLRLGDLMRGERATMGKSLLDVQRELRIRAAYIAAIENCDPSAFDTPGFIAGYVRSYARYLNMDPDQAFAAFCAESGFSTAHGMSAAASSARKMPAARQAPSVRDPFATPTTPFAPAKDAFFSQIEPRAVGSTLVLLMLIGTIGYGGWSVLNEVQRVTFAPVENTPDVLSDLDPLKAAPAPRGDSVTDTLASGGSTAARNDALSRMYRPQALDVPVLVARDAPIATIDPSTVGAFADRGTGERSLALAETDARDALPFGPQMPRVVAEPSPGVEMVAVRSAWVRVNASDGTVIFEGIMEAGDRYAVPPTEDPAVLRVGESGSVYFAVNGQHYGPVGPRGTVTSNVTLSVDHVTATYQVADLQTDTDLARTVAEAGPAAPVAD